MSVPLSALVKDLPDATCVGEQDPLVRGVAYDSRRVTPGDCFVCIRGGKDDGHRHIREALAQGAVALVAEAPPTGKSGVPVVQVPNARRALALLADCFYGHPSAELCLIGVTGTEGKTTTVYLIEEILRAAGRRTGMFGTIVDKVGDRVNPATLTTPESLDLQRLLGECVERGVTDVVMEVSSHALAQGRVIGCEFDAAVFTNLHTDHLDFHGTLERYLEAKLVLFSGLGQGAAKAGRGVGIVNADDPYAGSVHRACSRPIFTFGMDDRAQVRGHLLAAELGRTAFIAMTPQGSIQISLRLTGAYNVGNALAAVAVSQCLGIDLATIKTGLEQLDGIPGRFERVENDRDLLIVIDYAHTLGAYEVVLPTVRCFAERVITVFGCPGDRDVIKRPQIGRIVAKWSDVAIVTTDNPASEDPAAIAREIVAGITEVDPTGARHTVILDRAEAVRHALRLARPGDALLLAGKGHETVQIIGQSRIPYNDREVIEEALR